MSDVFDPYHQWLGIAPKDQPPNHYRLLGIEVFESNPEVIESAAERQSTYLHELSTGPQVKESQQLLNEIAAARLCLLSPAEKSKYDDVLRTEINAAIATDQLSDLSEELPWDDIDALEAEGSDTVRASNSDTMITSQSEVGFGASNSEFAKQDQPAVPSQGVPLIWVFIAVGGGAVVMLAIIMYFLYSSNTHYTDYNVQDPNQLNNSVAPNPPNNNDPPKPNDVEPNNANPPKPKKILAAQYSFEDAAAPLSDSKGSFFGTLYGAKVQQDNERKQNVLNFDGKGHAEIPRSFSNSFSIAFWIKTSQKDGKAEGSWNSHVGIVGGSSGKGEGFGVVLGGEKIGIGIGPKPENTVWPAKATKVVNNGWNHLVVVRNGDTGTVILFWNGQHRGKKEIVTGPIAAPDKLFLGKLQEGDKHFQGALDDLRIYNYALPAKLAKEVVNQSGGPPKTAAGSGTSSSPPTNPKPTPPKPPTSNVTTPKPKPPKPPTVKKKTNGFEVLKPEKATSMANVPLEIQPDGSILAKNVVNQAAVYQIQTKTTWEGITAIRLEALSHESLPSKGPGFGSNGRFSIEGFAASINSPSTVPFAGAFSLDVDGADRLVTEKGKFLSVMRSGKKTTVDFTMKSPVGGAGNKTLTVWIKQRPDANLGHFRLAATTDPKWAGFQLPLLVNLGGGACTTAEGNWVASKPYKPGSFGHVGGEGKSQMDQRKEVPDMTCVSGIQAFRAALPNATYKVVLGFRDRWSTKNDVTFSFTVEGKPEKKDLNLYRLSKGFREQVPIIYDGVELKDGVLDVEFKRGKSDPILNAIVVSLDYSK